MVKNPPASAENSGSIPESRRSPGGGNGNPLQYSCLGNLMDRGACPWHYSPWGHRVGPNLPAKQQQSATLGQALLDPETAKVNERWKPSSTQLRGKDQLSSAGMLAPRPQPWPQGSVFPAWPLLCRLHSPVLRHLPGKRGSCSPWLWQENPRGRHGSNALLSQSRRPREMK